MGGVTFTLDARAELTPQEAEWVRKYKLGKTMLYTKHEMVDRGSGLLGVASRLAFRMMNIQVTAGDLVNGKHIECKDIVEMRAVEELRQAVLAFKERYNRTWIVERLGYRTPAQVRAEQLPPAASAA